MNKKGKGAKMKVLDLGCGKKKHSIKNAEVIGLDKYRLEGVEMVHDLENTPLPFKDNEFDRVICQYILEHIENFFPLMAEIWRILKPNGIVEILVPYCMSVSAFASQDHKRFFSMSSFIYFIPNHPKNYYTESKARYVIVKKEFRFLTHMCRWKSLNKLINPILNLWHGLGERQRILVPDDIYFELKAVKK